MIFLGIIKFGTGHLLLIYIDQKKKKTQHIEKLS